MSVQQSKNIEYQHIQQQQQQQIEQEMLKQLKNGHRKNISSAIMTGRSKRGSQQKSTSRQKSKQKSKSKVIQNRLLKRMSFESPDRKQETSCSKNFSLLNYMLFKEKTMKITQPPQQSQHHRADSKILKKQHFVVLEVLGKGGFGRVMKVQYKVKKKIYAMKEMSKTVIITKKSIESVLNQRELLSELRHPFLVNMIYAFQDRQNLYLVMDLMPGGDLRYQIGRFCTFPQHIVKFFVCCIIVGLEYLHSNNIIHRDIKPQNLVIDDKGYLRITDMGVARIYSQQNYKDTSGTPGYMAPQVINHHNHSFQVDFFALGVIAYQCMLGKRPYRGYSRQQIREQILLYEASVKPHQVPTNWDPNSADFINKMLKRKQEDRLGAKGIDQLKSHPWFSDINWKKMLDKKYPSPFIPNMDEQNYDTVSISEYDDQYLQKMNENSLLLRQKKVQDLFKGYEYQQVKFF